MFFNKDKQRSYIRLIYFSTIQAMSQSSTKFFDKKHIFLHENKK